MKFHSSRAVVSNLLSSGCAVLEPWYFQTREVPRHAFSCVLTQHLLFVPGFTCSGLGHVPSFSTTPPPQGSSHFHTNVCCAGFQSFSNPPSRYHCTVFHTSQPSDPRPDSFQEGGGADLAQAAAARPSPSQAVLEREAATVRSIAAACPSFELEVSHDAAC